MSHLDVLGEIIELNDEGFMVQPEKWTEDVAAQLAREEEGLDTLTENHWKVIRFIRSYYLEKDLAPMIRLVCRETGLSLKAIYTLFPSGPAKGASKIAGLPKPDGCV